jgi:hypothetical protein
MRRPRAAIAVALAVLALALMLAACGGDDDDEGTTTSAAPSSEFPPPSGSASPPSAGGLQLPPGIAECLADQGFDIDPSELHSVPPEVLDQCFSALHEGGGAP